MTNGDYGYHRDELYYIDCAEHLSFGYVDHPPLTPLVAKVARGLLGDSLFAIRFFPALAGAAIIILAGLIARAIGGGRFAQILTAVAVLVTPRYLHANGMLQPVSFDQFFWVLCALLFVLLLKRENPRYWLLIGLVAGVGLMNKHTMLFFGFGILVALSLTPNRKYLASGWFWGGTLIALLVFLPNIAWQIRHDWPTLEFLRIINKTKMSQISYVEFLYNGQLWSQHILLFPLWMAGLYFYFFSREGERYRALGWIYVAVLAVLLVLRGKPYYLGPAYPMLLAGGAVLLERLLEKYRLRWLRPALVAGLTAACALTLPRSALPIYPVAETTSGDYKDMVGWEEMVSEVAEAHGRLSPEEQADCLIFAGNYGQAGAINFLGRRYGLPKAISGHNSHWIWGPGDHEPNIFIELGAGSIENLRKFYGEVQFAGVTTNPHGVENEEYNQAFYICRRPRESLKDSWSKVKHYD